MLHQTLCFSSFWPVAQAEHCRLNIILDSDDISSYFSEICFLHPSGNCIHTAGIVTVNADSTVLFKNDTGNMVFFLRFYGYCVFFTIIGIKNGI